MLINTRGKLHHTTVCRIMSFTCHIMPAAGFTVRDFLSGDVMLPKSVDNPPAYLIPLPALSTLAVLCLA